MSHTLPARLDYIVDEVGVGAILKHIEEDYMAVVVDASDCWKVCRYQPSEEPSLDVVDFVVEYIVDPSEWLVLTYGSEYNLTDLMD